MGIPGDNTYSNYQEASRSFWRQTVLPLVNRTAKALSGWLGPAYGGGLELRPDLDQIEALAGEREALWARLGKAEFLTDDEKRAAVGYGRKGVLEVIAGAGGTKYNPYHDDRGRFATGPGGGGAGDGDRVQEANLLRRLLGRQPKVPKPPQPSEQRLDEILRPGGKEVGERLGGAKESIRTVEQTEFESLKARLLDGSREIPAAKNYEGKWFERPDGTRFGVRESQQHGTTIDVIESGTSGLENGYRIHRR